ncbi:suppressor of npr1-1, constitutive 1 -like protein [Gossypium arboreum]|uniref:Suppressor of npr1-1, constitutive 1-like protein n=1 Tax=Gossypium arboreum TaxID=29729 RepID=A0A0B0PKZ7_GOSAR|nr:suppressor of npr1-1, constitutive 1 -like protein [Gossypium arboreum]
MGCPLRSLPSNFQPENLVILLLSYSNIEQLWKENILLYKLKVLNLKGSENLMKTPNFATTPNLEILVLEGCTRLANVHPSVGVLKRLKVAQILKAFQRLMAKWNEPCESPKQHRWVQKFKNS